MTTSHSFADLCKEEVTPLDLGEGSLDLEIKPNKEAIGIPPLTPIMETLDGFRSIDWANVRRQCRAGSKQCRRCRSCYQRKDSRLRMLAS